jgi:hypothetical protein
MGRSTDSKIYCGSTMISSVHGNEVSIKRKGKIVETLKPSKGLDLTGKDSHFNKFIQDGDTIVTGKKSMMIISSNGDKDKPRRWDNTYSTMVHILPESEVTFSTKKSETDEDTNQQSRYIITKTKLVKGDFIISSFEDIETPTATLYSLKRKGSGKGVIVDIPDDNRTIVCCSGFADEPDDRIEVTCKATGKKFASLPSFPQEIVITNGEIYRIPMAKMDERISQLYNSLIKLLTMGMGGAMETQQVQKMSEMSFSDLLKNSSQQQASFIDNMKKMQTLDVNTPGMTPEAKKQLEAMQKMVSDPKMQKAMGEFQKNMKEYQGKMDWMNQNLDMEKMDADMEKGKKKTKQFINQNAKDVDELFEKLPKAYAPLSSKFKVA